MPTISNELPEELKKMFDHVFWSIYLLNSTLTELQIISDCNYNNNELSIANSHPFKLYKMTLQYCLIMEYVKLFEKESKDKSEHISSLLRLNEEVLKHKKSFGLKFTENKEKLEKLKNSAFFCNIKKLRHKKIAHSQSHEINSPFDIKGFQPKDFEDGFHHLSIIKEVLTNCSSEFNFEYALQIPHSDKRTENFIRYHAKYKDYYYKNYLKATQEEGLK